MKSSIDSPKFLKKLIQLSEELDMPYKSVLEEAESCLHELRSVHQPLANILGFQVSQFILSRGYDKSIDVDHKEVEQVSRLSRKHSIAFVMTHKTYLDMFVLAVVLARHGIPFPYTFAGINMDFMGFGQLARQNGVIFIRRSFKEDKIYKACLRHFIATKLDERSDFMWAIEGTRSRTGKLVWPKVGILKYILEAEEDINHDVKYIPVSIVYDVIPDVKDMTMEGRGRAKRQESLQWFLEYVNKMGKKYGKISLRFGPPINVQDDKSVEFITEGFNLDAYQGNLSKFSIELVHQINKITPVTTASLICISLLSKFSLNKRAIEHDVLNLMKIIEKDRPDLLVDRGKPIGTTVQKALNLLKKFNLILQYGTDVNTKYVLNSENYMQATYYANMAVHHFYHEAFIELALLKTIDTEPELRQIKFWEEIMRLRTFFKFEFFYSRKEEFSLEIERTFQAIHPQWQALIESDASVKMDFLKEQKVLIAPVVLFTYIEAYKVTAMAIKQWGRGRTFQRDQFLEECQFIAEEMNWQGSIQRREAVSKPFLQNALRLMENLGLIPGSQNENFEERLTEFQHRIGLLSDRIRILQKIVIDKPQDNLGVIPFEREVVPGTKLDDITLPVIDDESGSHIGAFFDLDRTIIKNFSAREFVQTRLLSGKMTRREIISQFNGVLVYAMGNKNFAGLAAVSAQGVKGIKEEIFIEVGEDVYRKHLAGEIYPESRALVNAHLAKGHTVAIISAATPYQVNPIARDLHIKHVMCTRMEVKSGKFTGNIVEPACWGEGKAHAAKELAKKHKLDLDKSYFYTDSAEDAPLLEIVGKPVAVNPDISLSALAYQNNWPIYRFTGEKRPGMSNFLRTGMALGAMFPAIATGVFKGAMTMSWENGVNSLMASVGDFVISAAGMRLVVKGDQHLWSKRPAVFIFNHQSNVDLFIVSKLIRENATGIAKKELKNMPVIGQLMQAAGVIFIDRKNKEKAIEAMKPAVDALKNGTSIIIFPEGTRSKDYKLGPFKKGAFHMAMDAGVPIVPVIIRNAHDAMPRGTNIFRPAAIDVKVLAPISTKRWKKEKLTEHIEKIRNLYLKELDQLPSKQKPSSSNKRKSSSNGQSSKKEDKPSRNANSNQTKEAIIKEIK